MFGKTLLSIVSLLFATSQIVSVAKAEGCTFTFGTSCSLDDCGSLNEGYYAVFKDNNEDYKNINIPSTSTAGDNDGKLVYVSETGTKCEVKNETGYFISGESDKFISNISGTVANINKAGSGCTKGSINSDGDALCFDGSDDKIEFGTNEGYLFTDSNELFGNDNTAVLVVRSDSVSIKVVELTAGKNHLVHDGTTGALKAIDSSKEDATVDNGIDYCVDDNLIIWDRKKALCGSDSDCIYYTKDQNGWQKTNDNVKRVSQGCDPATCEDDSCEAGYYLVGGNSLYLCDGTIGCGKAAQTQEQIPIGLLVNQQGGYIECKYNNGSKECSAATITAKGASSDDDCKTVGGLYVAYDDNKTKLCLDTTSKISVDLETDLDNNGIDAEGKYIIPLGSSTGLFGIAGNASTALYITVSVDAVGNVKVIKETSKIRYRYTATDASTHKKTLYQIYDRAAAQTDANKATNMICDATGSKPFEFMYVESSFAIEGLNSNVDYYVEGDNNDLTAGSTRK